MRNVKSKAVSTNSMPAPWQSPDTPPTARRSHQNQPQISRGADRSAGTNQQAPNRMNSQIAKSEEHTSELQSLMRISYAVFCLKKKTEATTLTHREKKSKKK